MGARVAYKCASGIRAGLVLGNRCGFPFQTATTLPHLYTCVCLCVLGTHTSECIDCANLDDFQRLLWQSVVSEAVIIKLTSCVYHPKYACDFCIVYQYQYCYLDLVI